MKEGNTCSTGVLLFSGLYLSFGGGVEVLIQHSFQQIKLVCGLSSMSVQHAFNYI